jgi:hypothetical protein
MPEDNLSDFKIAGDVHRAIGRMEGKLDALVIQLTEHIKKDEIAWAEVSKLKGKIAWAAGVASTIVFFVTSGIFGILKKIGIL